LCYQLASYAGGKSDIKTAKRNPTDGEISLNERVRRLSSEQEVIEKRKGKKKRENPKVGTSIATAVKSENLETRGGIDALFYFFSL